jgi:phenylalanyl-tRNA synthetase beta chain
VKVSLSWLREYVDVGVPPESLAERLDLTGTKVEALHTPAESFRGVVVGEVLEISDHPNADNLTLVDVRSEDGRTQRVVCGARNFAVGDRVPLATVGARLGELEITTRTIRGETSWGMLCSPAELGISEDDSGILVLPEDAPVGEDAARVMGLDDTVIELELTPNRPDCMSMIGVAREVAAVLGTELRAPPEELVGSDDVAPQVSVEVEDELGCPRYLALEMDSVRVGPSPAWVQRRLMAGGLRPISNVVDATNYVMLEMGQPLHSFDATKISGRTIVVRRARPGEVLVTLDGVQRRLHPEDLLIADPEHALAFAGVIGGEDSQISDRTAEVILEAAYFNPASVAFTSRRHLLRTEASARFERGADPNMVPVAARRAAKFLAETAGARPASRAVDAYPARIEPWSLRLRPGRTRALLGIDVQAPEQASSLRALGLEATEGAGEISVSVPTFRPDLRREIDLIEEVARIAGYDRLPSTVPFGAKGGLTETQSAERRVRQTLASRGLSEAWTPSFGSAGELDALGLPAEHPARAMVELENPTSRQSPAMRTTLLPGLLRSAAHNLKQDVPGAALFEIARVYVPAGGELPEERLLLASVLSGRRRLQFWNEAARGWDFFAAKGILQAALESIRAPEVGFQPYGEMPWHPTRGASIRLEGAVIGALGELHPDVGESFEVAPGTVAFELALGPLFDALAGRPKAQDPPRFPGVYLDLALVVDDSAEASRVEDVIRVTGAPEVTSVRLFDVYRGEQVEEGRKSLAFGLEMRSPHRTLTDEEAHAVRDRIVAAAAAEVGAELRS